MSESNTQFSLELTLRQERESIQAIVEETYDHDEVIIDDWLESNMPAEIIKVTDDLQLIFDCNSEEEWAAIYRSFQFGIVVSQLLNPSALEGKFFQYFRSVYDSSSTREDMYDNITSDVDSYLQERVEINNLIATYLPEIDPTVCGKNDLCANIAGLAFMMADQAVERHETQRLAREILSDENLLNGEDDV